MPERSGERRRGFRHLVRGLKFRLAASYLLFFTVFLFGLGLVFRQMLDNTLTDQSLTILDAEWGEMKGYLKVENGGAVWMFDRFDPEESFIVRRIQRVYILMDPDGNIIERSDNYADGTLKPPPVAQVRAALNSPTPTIMTEHGGDGVDYIIRAGPIPEERRAGSRQPRRNYYVAVGRPMAEADKVVNGFTWRYFAFVPLMLALAGVMGWLLAGRALEPVNSVARVAQRTTGSNLSERIPRRGADDELDDLIDAFNRMTERLRQSFEQIRQFSTDVSHELRTPLTGIRGQLEVALFTARTPEQFRDAMTNALQDVEQLSNMVRALLQLSQAETGQVELQMSSVDLSRLVSDIVEQFQIPAEDEGVVLRCDCSAECMIRADKTQMQRLIANLLSNALKYTVRGGRATAGVSCEPGSAKLWVEDTGVGIPPENLPHIFDRFYRVRSGPTASKQGLGLGLSFVAWIVNAHGGSIDVSSTPGKGTRFTVTLPRRTELLPPAPSPGTQETLTA